MISAACVGVWVGVVAWVVACVGGSQGRTLELLTIICTSLQKGAYRGGGGVCKLEFLQFKFCAKFLYAICSVLLRICAGILWTLQAPTVSHEQLLGIHT